MNGSLYISFFQGQLEPVLEQVVQLAVQEISKTVGSSLNSMLLETVVKEQENKQLKLQLQSRENGGAADSAGSGRTKLGPLPDSHAPVHCTARGMPADARRLEQKGRVVGQLKGVMERVLDFAVCELTKIVEASFDDLLLEITKKEREQKTLEEYLGRSTGLGGGAPGDRGTRGASRRRGSKHSSSSPSGSEATREDLADVIDWVPILDKVFGQKWCSDIWQVKEVLSKRYRHAPQSAPTSLPLTRFLTRSLALPQNPCADALSASMLQRLLTLPAQLTEDDDDCGGCEVEPAHSISLNVADILDALAPAGGGVRSGYDGGLLGVSSLSTKQGEPTPQRRVWLECDECGRRFSRASLLKTHRQTHAADAASSCRKHFSSAARLQTHVQNHTHKQRF
uniref:C2H2-type domain-containing protein n=1 Tax=Gadus morhua TaxID=8049 RepID=A0A8C5B1L3_GADMO